VQSGNASLLKNADFGDGDIVNDANPFRGGPEQLIFGVGRNVNNPELNDPHTPYELESQDIAGHIFA